MSPQLDLFAAPACPPRSDTGARESRHNAGIAPGPRDAAETPDEPTQIATLAAVVRAYRVTTANGLDCAILDAGRWTDACALNDVLIARWFATPTFERETTGVTAEVLAQLRRLTVMVHHTTDAGEPVIPLYVVTDAARIARTLAEHPPLTRFLRPLPNPIEAP